MTKHTIASARTRLQLSQCELANQIGVSRHTIVNWERDSGGIHETKRDELATMLKVPKEQIWWGTQEDFIKAVTE